MTPSANTTHQEFGHTADGRPVRRWTIDDGELAISVLDLGGVLQSLQVPDAAGRRADVVLGFDDVAGYEATRSFAGGIIGRYANRITGGHFQLAGRDGEPVEHQLALNEGPNTVHGGPEGFHTRIWDVEPVEREGATGLRLRLTSPDGDQGFPGRLDVVAEYLLVPGERTLRIGFAATTDAPTVVSLTQHSYFNLAGVTHGAVPSLDGHLLTVHAGHYTPVDNRGLPSGEVAHVTGTSFDLRTAQPLDFLSLDHNFVIMGADEGGPETGHGHGHGRHAQHDHQHDHGPDDGLRPAAVLEHPEAGRRLEILTTEPGLQVYTGGGLDGSDIGKDGVPYRRSAAVALETQHYPDSPNHKEFPPTVLRPGEDYLTVTEWRFR